MMRIYKLEDGEILKLSLLYKVSEIEKLFPNNSPSRRTMYRILKAFKVDKPLDRKNKFINEVASLLDHKGSVKERRELSRELIAEHGALMVYELREKIKAYEELQNGS